MNGQASPLMGAGAPGRVCLDDRHPAPADLRAEVLHGLGRPRKCQSPKLFYDRRGSRLFDAITELPEYYPTRTEIAILRAHAAAMALYDRGQAQFLLHSRHVETSTYTH